MLIEGRCWCFGADVTTDEILPGAYLDRSADEVARYAMAGADPEFASRVQPGDLLVAGPNFGCGSGRELAPAALKGCGIRAIVAPSFSRLFFRNCINLGLVAAIVDDTRGFDSGDWISVDVPGRSVHNARTGVLHPIVNLTGISREILDAGGIIPFTRARLAARR